MTDLRNAPLSEVDPTIAEAIDNEVARQAHGLELIASENFVSEAVLEAAGSVFTNKYAEGYPKKRYYGGCEWTDVVEQTAIDRAKQIFGADHASVPPSGWTVSRTWVIILFRAPRKPLKSQPISERPGRKQPRSSPSIIMLTRSWAIEATIRTGQTVPLEPSRRILPAPFRVGRIQNHTQKQRYLHLRIQRLHAAQNEFGPLFSS